MKKSVRYNVFGMLCLFILCFTVYFNSFSSGFTFDSVALLEHHYLRDVRVLCNEFWQPGFGEHKMRFLGFLTFALNYTLHGPSPFGYHLVNVLIHLLNGLLVWRIAYLLSGRGTMFAGERAKREMFALAAAALFLVHPIQTQAVTYFYQRLAALVSFFYLSAVLCYVKARMADAQFGRRLLFFLLTGFSFALGLLTKQNILTFPLMIVLLEACFFQETGWQRRRSFWVWGIGGAVGICLALVLFFRLEGALFVSPQRLSNDQLHVNSYSYFLTQAKVILRYLQLIAFPVGQSLDHHVPLSRTIRDWPTVLSGIVVLSFFLLGVMTVRKHRLIGFGIMWFFIAAAVECSIIPIRHVMFEHRMYLPMAGLAMSFSAWVIMRFPMRQSVIFFIAVMLALGGLTVRRNAVWENGVTLWQDVVKKSPLEARGHTNLGKAYLEQGDYDRALHHLELSALLNPAQSAQVDNNIGLIYLQLKQYDLAEYYFQKSLRREPGGIGTYNNLGGVYLEQGDDARAEEYFRKELNNSDHLSAYNNLGLIFMRRGLLGDAEEAFLKAKEMNPYQKEAYENLAAVYQLKQDLEREKDIYQDAVKKFPRDEEMRHNFFSVCLELKDDACLAEALGMVLRYQTDAASAVEMVSITALEGHYETARQYYEKLLRRFPKAPEVYLEYGKFLGNYDQFGHAIAVWGRGMKAVPDRREVFQGLIVQARQLQRMRRFQQ